MNVRAFFLVLTAAVLSVAAPDARASKEKIVKVYADTSEEIVTAFQEANNSGKPAWIKVAPGHYVFPDQFGSEEFGPSGLPPVQGSIVIEGEDASTTFFEGSAGRYFTVLTGGKLFARNLTLTNGFVVCELEDCSRGGGGAAANFGGLLSLEHCVLKTNGTSDGRGEIQVFGGAVLQVAGKLRIFRSTVSNNSSLFSGGGIAIKGGVAFIRRSLITQNIIRTGRFDFGSSRGGGIYVSGGKLVLLDSTVSQNVLTDISDEWFSSGGGLYNSNGTVWIVNSAITANGALPLGQGAGIHNGGEMSIIDSTIGGNVAASAGGGIYNSGRLELQGVTLADNEAQGAVLHGPGPCVEFCDQGGGGLWNAPSATAIAATSIIGRNTGPFSQDCSGVLISRGGNAIGDLTGCSIQASQGRHRNTPDDLTSLDPLLGALQDNGEAGRAHYPLLATSPLIDAGGKVGRLCEYQDQLGHRRRDGDGDGKVLCDIGAVEFRP